MVRRAPPYSCRPQEVELAHHWKKRRTTLSEAQAIARDESKGLGSRSEYHGLARGFSSFGRIVSIN